MALGRITISVSREERSALMRMAAKERRSDRDQAAYLLCDALRRAGYLAGDEPTDREELLDDGH